MFLKVLPEGSPSTFAHRIHSSFTIPFHAFVCKENLVASGSLVPLVDDPDCAFCQSGERCLCFNASGGQHTCSSFCLFTHYRQLPFKRLTFITATAFSSALIYINMLHLLHEKQPLRCRDISCHHVPVSQPQITSLHQVLFLCVKAFRLFAVD